MQYKNNRLVLPQEIYAVQLKKINAVALSQREIDVIACTLNGRSAKGIAHFLSISHRTVQVHIYNAMQKMDCSSRESLIALIEKSNQFIPLKEYYFSLLTYSTFQNSLKEIAKLGNNRTARCLLVYWHKNESAFFHNLQIHLNLAGITPLLEARDKNQSLIELVQENHRDVYTLYAIPDILLKEFQEKNDRHHQFPQDAPKPLNNALLLFSKLEESREILTNFHNFTHINSSKQKNYYFLVFEILKKLLPHIEMEGIINEFKKQDEFANAQPESKSPHKESYIGKELSFSALGSEFLKTRKLYLLFAFITGMAALSVCFIVLSGGTAKEFKVAHSSIKESESAIRSDLLVPSEPVFLNRPKLITKIDDYFQKQLHGIQTVVLIGIGGSGKTTLAREYARQQKASIIWEIHAETNSSLIESFENLAYALSTTHENKVALHELQEIKNFIEREKKLIRYVKDQLRLTSNWFLIFDNVKNFIDIQKYFPQDLNTWGDGRIILTTRNTNIQNNSKISHVLLIGELTQKQKLNLFTKIMNQGESHSLTNTHNAETEKFLENLPPFPLDVSVAAYYLKSINISYKDYIENLKTYNSEFCSVQENILKEAGTDLRTRYGIISLSLEYLIKSHKDFGELLLFISLLDSRNIPRNLLRKCKSDAVIDSFIYNLKKYSLVINNSNRIHSNQNESFSIHRSTQSICLDYLVKVMKLNENKQFILSIANTLEDYIIEILEMEDFSRSTLLMNHCERFLSHKNLLTESIKGSIESKLGGIYFFLYNYIKAKQFLEESIPKIKKSPNKNSDGLVWSLVQLGNVYRIFGEFEKAKECLELSLMIYKNNFLKDTPDIAFALAYLGNVYRELGNYEKARILYTQSLLIYKKNFSENHIKVAWNLVHLGHIYKILGDYKKAQDFLERGLLIYKNNFPKNHVKIAWNLLQLGKLYWEMGYDVKAQNLCEQSLQIYKNHSENSVDVAKTLASLGNVYSSIGKNLEAKQVLERCLKIYKNHLDADHKNIAEASVYLGTVYKELGDYTRAKNLFENSLIVYEKHYNRNHIEIARVLTLLGQNNFLNNHLELAETFFNKSLNIYQIKKHPETYICLENLSELYLKKSMHSINKENFQQAQDLKAQAINNLKNALAIVKDHFPEDSPHIIRIQSKITKLKEQK